MKKWIYLLAGVLFAIGLSLSGMTDPLKVKGFLAVGFADWNPAVLFVLGAATPTYLAAFFYLRRRQKSFDGAPFQHPKPRPVDKKLVLGAVLFGVGWGIAGICPGPALAHLAYLDVNFAVFLAMMFVGFEWQGRLKW